MISKESSTAASELALKLSDFRLGEIEPITDRSVIEFSQAVQEQCDWMHDSELNQFILGLCTSVGSQYWNKNSVITLLNNEVGKSIQTAHLVSIQEDNSSQSNFVRLLRLSAEGHPDETKGLDSSHLLYIDDATFTGRSLARNLGLLASQIRNLKMCPRVLVVFHISEFRESVRPTIATAIEQLKELGVSVSFKSSDSDVPLLDRNALTLAPSIEMLSSDISNRFLKSSNSLRSIKESRTQGTRQLNNLERDPLFKTPSQRRIVTQGFLEVGIRIRFWSQHWTQTMRPLGFVSSIRDESFGFGAMFSTFHNSANTSPLALWWGDSSAHHTSALSKWSPLLPRRPQ